MVCVVVASTTEMKVEAAREYFKNEFTDVNVLTFKAPSGVNEQPLGHNETLLGANNRVKRAMEEIPGKDLYVGIESGIFEVTDPVGNGILSCYFDCAWVVLRTSSSSRQPLPRDATAISHSVGIKIENSVVEAVQKDPGFAKQTIGLKMAELNANESGFNAQDPHIFLTSGRKCRKDMIREAIEAAYGQLLHNMDQRS